MKTVYTVDSSVEIKNVNGTGDRSCCCGSWIEHWENYSGKKRGKCSVSGCSDDGTEGAHVVRPKAQNEDYKTHPYIVPMCKTHNGKRGDTFTSKSNVTFVWANKSETCEK